MPSNTGVLPSRSQGLVSQVRTFLSEVDVRVIERAVAIAASAHQGSVRESGEPYVTHSLAVAESLAELRLDRDAIVAALLHDVVGRPGIEIANIERSFGCEAARLTASVDKINAAPGLGGHAASGRPPSGGAGAAKAMRMTLVALADDVRVVLIKLADVLDTLRVVRFHPEDVRRDIARTAMDVYAPLVDRLGLWEIKWRLEDMAFGYLEPEAYREIAEGLSVRRAVREQHIARAIDVLQATLRHDGIRAEISGRSKHLYGVYRKMLRSQGGLDRVSDLLAVRVLVNTEWDCYAVLGHVHALWTPLEGQFDDYIARPKRNGYRSLHTTVRSVDGIPLEVQIRTHEMHREAEYGVAAWRPGDQRHWKEGGRRSAWLDSKVAWMRQLLDWQQDVAAGVLPSGQSPSPDPSPDYVYVLTPQGDVVDLKAGATPVDFAYRIHTEVGHRCSGARVNGRMVPLTHRLRDGDVVEVITGRGSKGPSGDWLNPSRGFVRTASARDKIRAWFQDTARAESIKQGRARLEVELRRRGLEYAEVSLDDVAGAYGHQSAADLLVAIGKQVINAPEIARQLAGTVSPEPLRLEALPSPSLDDLGAFPAGDMLTRLAKCCTPVPGDEIVGYITRGRGVTVHRITCINVAKEDERERLLRMDWGRAEPESSAATVRVDAWDRVGLARDVVALLADEGLQMSAQTAVVRKNQTATIWATVEVSSLDTLTRVLHRLRGIKDVFNVVREVGGQLTLRGG